MCGTSSVRRQGLFCLRLSPAGIRCFPLLSVFGAKGSVKSLFMMIFAGLQIAVFARQHLIGTPVKALRVFATGDLPLRERAQRQPNQDQAVNAWEE